MSINLATIMGHHLKSQEIVELDKLLIKSVDIKNALEHLENIETNYYGKNILKSNSWEWSGYLGGQKITEMNSAILERTWSSAEENNIVMLSGSSCLFFFGKKALSFQYFINLQVFCEEPKLQFAVRKFIFELAKFFGQQKVLYSADNFCSAEIEKAHELIINSGFTFEEVENWLINNYKAPATTLQNFCLIDAENPTENNYYLDCFQKFALAQRENS